MKAYKEIYIKMFGYNFLHAILYQSFQHPYGDPEFKQLKKNSQTCVPRPPWPLLTGGRCSEVALY
jgi:hypothetical protein